MSKRMSTNLLRRILVDPFDVLVIVEHLPSDFVSFEHWFTFWVSFFKQTADKSHARLVGDEVIKIDDEVSKVDDEVSKVDGEVSKTICTTATGTRWQEEKKRKKKIS